MGTNRHGLSGVKVSWYDIIVKTRILHSLLIICSCFLCLYVASSLIDNVDLSETIYNDKLL